MIWDTRRKVGIEKIMKNTEGDGFKKNWSLLSYENH